MKFIVTSAILLVFWVLLSGFFDAFHLITGALSCLFVAWLSSDLLMPGEERLPKRTRRVISFILYLPWLLVQIVKASIDVAYRVLHPKMPIDPRIIKFRPDLEEDLGIATLANSITLTPGTVTIEASRENGFIIHAISEAAAEELLEGEMIRRVEKIERSAGEARDV